MYSAYNYLPDTGDVISNIQGLVLSFDCTLAQVSNTSGVSFGCLKHLLYGTGERSEPGEMSSHDQGAAPRYDRVIRLLAGKHIPHDVLLADGQPRDDLMQELVVFCVTPIQQVLREKLKTRTLSAREQRYLPSRKRMSAVAGGKPPQLDFVVRILKARTLSPDDLVPPIWEDASGGERKCLLPAGLTEENTRGFFADLRKIFTLR